MFISSSCLRPQGWLPAAITVFALISIGWGCSDNTSRPVGPDLAVDTGTVQKDLKVADTGKPKKDFCGCEASIKLDTHAPDKWINKDKYPIQDKWPIKDKYPIQDKLPIKDNYPIPTDGVKPGDGAFTKPTCSKVSAALDKQVDLLFVVDDSGSMEQEQSILTASFSTFVDALKLSSLGGKLPDLRIGVINTDLGAGTYLITSCVPGGSGGKLQNKATTAGCVPPKDPWIEYTNGTTNVPSGSTDPIQRVKDAFSCIAELGTSGCGFEHTLLSAQTALDPAKKVNPSFLRPDAILAVVFLTDEDDCSAQNTLLFDPSQTGLNDPLGPLTSFRCFEFGITCTCPGFSQCTRFIQGVRTNCHPEPKGNYLVPINTFMSFFKNLKQTPQNLPHPERVLMASIAGPTDVVNVGASGSYPALMQSCSSTNGFAVPAIRVQWLTHAFASALTAKEINDIKAGTSKLPYWIDQTGTWREQNISSICAADYSAALKQLAQRIIATMGTRCAKTSP